MLKSKNILSTLAINGTYNFLNLNNNSPSLKYLLTKYKHNNLSFGLFITVERVLDKKKEWPDEVHGCLGYYTIYPFKNISNALTISKAIKLGYNTTYTDSRLNKFPNLMFDYLTNFKVSVMLLPVISIDPNTGLMQINNDYIKKYSINTNNRTKKRNNSITKQFDKTKNKRIKIKNNHYPKFNNNKYGLITLDSNMNTATYLPEVFPNSKWSDIKNKILNKTGIKNNNEYTNRKIFFYAYKTETHNMKLISFFTNKELLALKYLEHIITLSNLFNKNNQPAYNIINNNIYFDDNQYVRNCGICSDIIKAIYSILNILSINFINNYLFILNKILTNSLNYLLYVWKLYLKNNRYFRQSSSFIIVGLSYYYQIMQVYYKIINTNIKILTDNYIKKQLKIYCMDILLNVKELEQKFEYGECGVALFTITSKFNILNMSNLELFIIKKNIIFNITGINDIFQLNWIIQMIVNIRLSYKLIKREIILKVISNLLYLLDNYYLPIFNQVKNKTIIIKNKLNKLETNYIAVAYEACMNIFF